MPTRACLPSLAGLLALACGSRGNEARPNVLLISLDSVRADFVGAYGGTHLPRAPGRSPTPNLDRLAAEGVLYTEAISTTSWTLPAHVSLFTGTPELVHGVEQDGQCIAPDQATLPEELREHGYRTYGVYSGPYLDPRHGFGRGFERYEAGYGPELARATAEAAAAAQELDSIDPLGDAAGAQRALARRTDAERALELASHRDVSSQRVTDLALAELERAAGDGRPFFVFAHYFDPHYDYVPPAPCATAFDPDYRGALDGHDFFTRADVASFDEASPTGRRRVVDERGLEHLRALYAGEIAWTDEQVGRLLDELERRGLAQHTLVVVVGDHGDEFFEHGSIGHRQTLHEEVVRVPMLLRLPGRLPAGERRAGVHAIAQLFREIEELAGIRSGGARSAESEAGSLARLVRMDVVTLSAEVDGRVEQAGGVLVRVLETFRLGPTKIQRERAFTRATDAVAPAVARALEQQSRERLRREDLRWIDLAAHPDEAAESWSEDFSQGCAREALRAFRAAYETLARERHAAPLAEESADLLSALRGLGYVGQEARLGTLAAGELLLPPPGESLLDFRPGR